MKRLIVVALCLAGCRQRGGLQLEGSAYRLVSQEGGGLLLPPPVVNRQLEFVIPVRAGAVQGAPCRVAGDAFELRIEGGKALLRLLKMGEWEELLAAPELLEQRKCLPAAAAIEVKQLLRATLPL